LKVLEGENAETLGKTFRLFHERALPDLGDNIKCGNSLIGPDFYEGQQLSLLDDEERYRVNAFDWDAEFPEIMAAGGFDAVIGNPPYGFHQIHSEYVKPYFKEHFAAAHGSYEHYFLFYDRSLRLLRDGGTLGFIVPVTWLTIPSARTLREFILNDFSIVEICWLPELVFANARVNTLVSTIRKCKAGEIRVKIYDSLGFREPPKEERVLAQSELLESSDYSIGVFTTGVDQQLLNKIAAISQPLGNFARPCSGYNPYEVGKGQDPQGRPQTPETVSTKPYHSERQLGPEWKPEIVGRNLERYSVNITGMRWVKYGPWLAAPRQPSNFLGKRILIQEITGGKARRIIAAYFDGELYHSRDVIPVKIERDCPHPLYLLGIINSKLITWYHHKKNPKAQKGLFPKVLVSDVRNLPIRDVHPDDPKDRSRHDRVVQVVNTVLKIHKDLQAAKTDHEKSLIQRQIDTTDKRIDQLVYELYGLEDDEIRIIEEGTK